jgi:hypothetical protein
MFVDSLLGSCIRRRGLLDRDGSEREAQICLKEAVVRL